MATITIRGDRAIRYLPHIPSVEDDLRMLQAALDTMSVEEKLAVGVDLLRLREGEPLRAFLPTPWVKAELASKATVRPAPLQVAADEPDDHDDDHEDDDHDREEEED